MKLIRYRTLRVRKQSLGIKQFYGLGVLAVLMAMPSVASAWSSDPSVNTPIAVAADDQGGHVVVEDGFGGAIIAWTDYRNPTTDRDIYAQRIDATGAVQWTLNGVPICTAADRQAAVHMIGDGSGGAIIAWSDQRGGVYAQRIDTDGNTHWIADGILLSGMNTAQSMVSDGVGGAIMAWKNTANDVYAQRINASGNIEWASGGKLISVVGAAAGIPVITSDGNGGAIVTWAQGSGSEDVFAQRVDASGDVQWAAGGVTVAADPDVYESVRAVAADESGGAVIFLFINGLGFGAQKLDSNGVTQWPTAVWLANDGNNSQSFISDGLGGALTSWWGYRTDTDPVDPQNDRAVYVQGVDTDGNLRWPPDGLLVGHRPYRSSGDTVPLVSDNAGGFIASWAISDSNYNLDVYAQHFNASGLSQWGTSPLAVGTGSNSQTRPAAVGDGAGGSIFVWQDYRNGADDDLYAHKISADGSTSGLLAPSNVSPAAGTRVQSPPILTASAFVDEAGQLSHAASQWRVNVINTVTPELPEHDISVDDGYFTYTLPFSFPFFERRITSISVNANGLVELLEDGESDYANDRYGTHSEGEHINNMDAIFAANDDLDLSNGYLRLYNAGNRVVIEWYGATYLDADADPNYPDFANTMLFQVVLHQDGRITWNFSQLNFNLYDYDLYSGLYPNGGTEISMVAGSLTDVITPSAFEFNPATRAITPATYAWFTPQPVMYDSGESTDLRSHLVPGTTGLEDGVTYYWGVRYLADNNEWSPWSMPIGFVADTLPPIVALREPPHGDTGVAINTVIRSTFSEAMAPGSINEFSFTLSGPGGNVAGTVGYAAMAGSFTPAGDLAPNTTYTATITTAVTDTVGKHMEAADSWSFATGTEADMSPPQVDTRSPGPDAVDVAVDISAVSITFNEPMNPATINQSRFTLTGPGGAVSGMWSYDAATQTARIDPDALLAFATIYTVAVTEDIQDNAGNALAADSWNFATADVPLPPTLAEQVPPRVVSATPTTLVPASIPAVTVTFSEPIQHVDTNSFRVSHSGGAVPGTVQYDAAAMTAWFYPTADLAFETQFTVRIIGNLIHDMADNEMLQDEVLQEQDYVGFFSTLEDPVAAGCDPDAGNEAGCDSFDEFTYGTGIDLNTYGSSITGYTAEYAARGSVSFEESLTQNSTNSNAYESQAVARVNNTIFSLRSRSRRMESSPDLAGTWSMGASKIEVKGVPPGAAIPMSIVISGNFTGPSGTLILQVRDFDNYRMLGNVKVTGSGHPFTIGTQTYPAIVYQQMIDPFGNKDDASNYVETTANGSGGYRLEFLYPSIPNNGIYVWFVAGVKDFDGVSNDETDFTARLKVDPPPGVTVTLASGQVFSSTVDADGDGVADSEETDANEEANPAIATPPAVTGIGNIIVNVSTNAGVTLSQVKVLDDDDLSLLQDGKPTDQDFPDGVVSFRLNGLEPGATATVDLTFPTAFPANPTYYKVGDLGFYEFLGAEFIDDHTVRLTLTDGGSDDHDGLANGVIADPGGVAVPITVGPLLSTSPAGPGAATISWDPGASGYFLEETLSLTPANWLDSISGSNNPVVVPATETTKFYRLKKP